MTNLPQVQSRKESKHGPAVLAAIRSWPQELYRDALCCPGDKDRDRWNRQALRHPPVSRDEGASAHQQSRVPRPVRGRLRQNIKEIVVNLGNRMKRHKESRRHQEDVTTN